MFKKILLGLLGLVVLILAGLYLFVDSEVYTERSILVSTAPQFAFDQANTLPNWTNWSPYDDDDPTIKLEYSTQKTGQGAYYTWEGKKAGSGKLTIIESLAPKSINTRIEFVGQGEGYGKWIFSPEGSGTRVTWGFGTNVGMNPIGKVFAIMMPSQMGKYLDKGLADLKRAAEAVASKPISKPQPVPQTITEDKASTTLESKKGG